MRKFLLLSFLISLLCITCDKNEDPVLTINQETIEAPANGNSTSVTLFSNNPWTVSHPEWCTVTPKGGEGGEAQVRITVNENDTYQDRSCSITFVSGELSKVLQVSQAANLGVVLPQNEFKVSSKAQQLEIVVKANIKYKVEISADWITMAGTKSLETTTYLFDIEENTSFDPRQGIINIISEKNNETITVEVDQVQKDAIFISPTEFNLTCQEHILDLKVETNVELEVIIPDNAKGWVSHVETKALQENTITLKVNSNSDYDPRNCEIVVKKKNDTYSESVFISQEENKGFIISEKEFNLSNKSQNVEVKLKSNAELQYEVSPEGKEWISIVETKALDDRTLVLAIKENTAYDIRQGNVYVRMARSNDADTIKITQQHTDTLFVNERLFNVVKEGETIKVKVSSTVEYDIEIKNDWISESETKALTEKEHSFVIKANEDIQGRNGAIIFKSRTTAHKDSVIVNQNGTGGYIWYNGIKASASVPGNGTENDPYIIHTANDLQWLIDQANTANATTDKYYRLTHNLTIDSSEDIVDASGNVTQAKGWTPIGMGTDNSSYRRQNVVFGGSFDGGGHTIDGTMVPTNAITDAGHIYLGLFGYCKNTASPTYIKNLTLNYTLNCKAQIDDYDDIYVGALIGFCDNYNMTISDCINKGNIQSGTTNGVQKTSVVGGIIGQSQGGTSLKNVHNYGNIINGWDNTPIYIGYAGGLIGSSHSTLNVDGCTNTGKIESKDIQSLQIGGLFGEISELSLEKFISNSHNTGVIKAGGCTVTDSQFSTNVSIGGISGGSIMGTTNSLISDCSNTGAIIVNDLADEYNSTVNAGGLGTTINWLSVKNFTNKGNFTFAKASTVNAGGITSMTSSYTTLEQCYNYGTFSYNGNIYSSAIAGIVCNNDRGTLKGCINYANITGNSVNNPESVSSKTAGIAASNGGTIEECINKGDIKGGYGTGGFSITGGVTGDGQNGTITNSINEGNITSFPAMPSVNYGGSGGNIYMAGIIAQGISNVTVKGCVNKGNVTADKTGVQCFTGGISGLMEYSTLDACKNEGKVTGGSREGMIVGGFPYYSTATTGGIAAVLVDGCTIKNGCENIGTIIAGTTSNEGKVYTGSIVGYVNENKYNPSRVCSCSKDSSGGTWPLIGGGVTTIYTVGGCTSTH